MKLGWFTEYVPTPQSVHAEAPAAKQTEGSNQIPRFERESLLVCSIMRLVEQASAILRNEHRASGQPIPILLASEDADSPEALKPILQKSFESRSSKAYCILVETKHCYPCTCVLAGSRAKSYRSRWSTTRRRMPSRRRPLPRCQRHVFSLGFME